MIRLRKALLVALLAAAAVPTPARPQGGYLAAAIGAGAGLAAGGYVTVAVVVARARIENEYVFGIDDILDWESIPVIVGPATGVALGLWDDDRLVRTVIGGAAGTVAGMGVGLIVGGRVWEPPDGRWAGAAIGAGAGLILGSLAGMVWPERDPASPEDPVAAAVPVTFRIRF